MILCGWKTNLLGLPQSKNKMCKARAMTVSSSDENFIVTKGPSVSLHKNPPKSKYAEAEEFK